MPNIPGVAEYQEKPQENKFDELPGLLKETERLCVEYVKGVYNPSEATVMNSISGLIEQARNNSGQISNIKTALLKPARAMAELSDQRDWQTIVERLEAF